MTKVDILSIDEMTLKDAVKEFGNDKYYGLIMPYLNGKRLDCDEVIKAERIVNELNMSYTILPIDRIIEVYDKWVGEMDEVQRKVLIDNIRLTITTVFTPDFKRNQINGNKIEMREN